MKKLPPDIMPELRIGKDALHDPAAAAGLEWLETNGLGGFASGAVPGIAARRYHGLLVCATTPPTGRMVLVNKIEETVATAGQTFTLGANRFPGVIHPRGDLLIDNFRLAPFPVWTFNLGGSLLEKSLCMLHDSNTVAVRWRWVDQAGKPLPHGRAPAASLRVRVFSSFRDYHSLASRNPFINPAAETRAGETSIKPYENCPRVAISHLGFEFTPSPDWYLNYEYDIERERGLDFREDLFTHGEFTMEKFRGAACMTFTADAPAPAGFDGSRARTQAAFVKSVDGIFNAETTRRAALLDGFADAPEIEKRLILAADQFIVRRGSGQRSVIAGYPWFADWGRDTMISLPGLCLLTRRFDIAREILETYAAHCRHGLLPNNFPDSGSVPGYNSIDSALWFFIAAAEYEAASGDRDFLPRKLLPVFRDIISHLMRGTINRIKVDASDGLLSAGDADTQLTWMDARADGVPVTPRHGKAVEINALWHNALVIAARAADASGAPEQGWRFAAAMAKKSFAEKFWNPDSGCLFDVVRSGFPDPAVRPNQIFALSLPERLLDGDKARSALDTVERLLLTPAGLRTLAPGDPAYRGPYSGGPFERDSAYHQGPVWAWPLGHYVRAALAVRGRTPENIAALEKLLPEMLRHIKTAGLGSVSEIFDGDAPHAPRGCFAQAWSVAEWLAAARAMRTGA